MSETTSTNGKDGPHEEPSERIKRPRLERDAPFRSFEGLFGFGRQNQDAPRVGAGSATSDVISSSVEAAYRVVEAQLEYGRRIADQFGMSGAAGLMSGNPSNMTGNSGLDPLIRAYTNGLADLTALWVKAFADAMAPFANAGREMPTQTSSQASASANGSSAQPRYVIALALRVGERGSIETPPLDGVGPGEISVSSLRDGDEKRTLPVQVSSGLTGNTARFMVDVPPDQPAGRYDGIIWSSDGTRLGALSLTVTP